MTWITAGLVALLPFSWWQGRRQARSARRRTEDASVRLHQLQAHQRALMDSIDDIAWLKDRDSRFLMVNRKFAELFGRTPEAMVGLSDYDISSAKTAARYQQIDRDVMATRAPQRVEERIANTEGGTNWAETIKVPVFDERGEVIGTAGVARDITVRKHYEHQASFLAQHDPLTGLHNRRYLESQFDEFAKRHRRFVAIFLDLDNFKMINDTDGHSVGDEVLRILAARLKNLTQDDELLVRLGGDEFLLLKSLTDLDVTAIDMLALRIEEAIGAPCRVSGNRYVVSSSIGIASYPEHGSDHQSLVKHADIAMYEAKKSGRHRYCWFHEALANATTERRNIELRIREALEADEFALHYQPVCDAESGRIIGAEALIRLKDRGGQAIPPALFIPIAEQGGLIEPIGEWVIHTGLKQLAHWREQGHTDLQLAINISGTQFASGRFVEHLESWIEESGVPGSALELELTEGVLMADVEKAQSILSRIGALGVRLAVDDFGTGYSSLAYLKHLPIHRLKIDRSFVDGLPSHPGDTAITRSILQLAKTFLLEVTAEGVETQDQLEFLRRAGCNAIQGFLQSQPRPAAEFSALLERRHLP
ncbi:putative bifunctional diguanylate cyclase/phosphodiesterase [Niveibacterium terrae]|uniref:putative bifunctional diguanylate cyclase/phosphodiesterase n=1 Tax=Niveibacterium terrae TaxID=3373598 RepID=UPI003A8DADB5